MKVTGILWLPLSFLDFIERRYDTMTTQKQSALQTIEEKKSLIVGIADKVWEFAELSLQEFKSAETYCEALEKEGFDVERGTCNIETAFAASYGHGRPYIGILAEYDALSGAPAACEAMPVNLYCVWIQEFEEPVATSFTSSGCQVSAASSFFQRPSRAINAFAAPPSSPGHP